MAIVVIKILETLVPFSQLALLSLRSFLILLYKWVHTKNRYRLPSPRKLPIIGNLHQLGSLPHRSLRSMSKQYGDVMLLHLGSKPTLVVSSADAAEEILKTHDIVFANRPYNKVASIILYNCRDMAFANYGEYWRKMKSICVSHMFSNKKVQSFRNIREEEAALMVENIKLSTPLCEPVNLSYTISSFTNDVLSRVAFGRKYADEQGGSRTIRGVVNEFSETLGAFSIGNFIPWLSWIDRISGVLHKATKVAKAFDIFIEKIVQDHINRAIIAHNEKDDDDEDEKGEKVQDLVDVLLEIQRNDPSLERDSVKALLLDMLAAGTETTSTSLEWVMTELFMHPRVMKQLQEEVRGILRGKTSIDEDDLKSMVYLKAVIKEVLRLHPPAPLLLFREASQDAKALDSEIAAGTQVIINAYAIQRLPAYWDEPEQFKPERFLRSEFSVDYNNKGLDFKYIPFGGGRRGCPGMSLAIAKVEIALANLVGHFDWKLPAQVQPNSFMAESFGTAVQRRDPLIAIPTPWK